MTHSQTSPARNSIRTTDVVRMLAVGTLLLGGLLLLRPQGRGMPD